MARTRMDWSGTHLRSGRASFGFTVKIKCMVRALDRVRPGRRIKTRVPHLDRVGTAKIIR